MSEFGQIPYSEDETSRISAALNEPLSEEISVRPGPRGSKLQYIEHWKAVGLANDVFGFGGWSCAVEHLGIDYADEKNGRWNVGAYAIVKVSIRNGCCHCDVGWGQADNMKNRGDAYEKAKKSAVSDARKRAMRVFGARLGNSIYDKENKGRQASGMNKRARVHGVNNGYGNNNYVPKACAPGFNPRTTGLPTNSGMRSNAEVKVNGTLPSKMYGIQAKGHVRQENQVVNKVASKKLQTAVGQGQQAVQGNSLIESNAPAKVQHSSRHVGTEDRNHQNLAPAAKNSFRPGPSTSVVSKITVDSSEADYDALCVAALDRAVGN